MVMVDLSSEELKQNIKTISLYVIRAPTKKGQYSVKKWKFCNSFNP